MSYQMLEINRAKNELGKKQIQMKDRLTKIHTTAEIRRASIENSSEERQDKSIGMS